MAGQKPTRRRYEYRGRCDPRIQPTYYVEQFCSGSWREVFSVTGWRPSRAVVIPRSQLDAETVRWLAEFHRLNSRK
jgi:hypothetical protein